MHVARLQISGVRGFHGRRAVDLDFERPNGSLAGWTVLAGRNGSGKSTLLQALGLVLAGPRSTGFIPSLADWISNGVSHAEINAPLRVSKADSFLPTLTEPRVWMRFEKAEPPLHDDDEAPTEPEFSGEGLDSLARSSGPSSVHPNRSGWFYAGYGPFRHLGSAGRNRRASMSSKVAQQVASLFDETISLTDAVDWLIDQRLYAYEERPGAEELLATVKTLLSDSLLPDGFQVSDVTSDGLWISNRDSKFPLREMSDGYRAVTALIVDIVRQMYVSYGELQLQLNPEGIATLPYPGVILIDEVDAHLHVSWQKKIGTWLKEHFPEIQFIVTTHSPYVCQSADPGGLILLPGPGENRTPRIINDDLYERIVYGSGDDAVISELFGVDTIFSTKAEVLRRRLSELEPRVINGSATPDEKAEYRSISHTLTSSLSTRVDEVIARLAREQ